ncbi:MAG: hypothetical protein OEY34_04570, partial [Cyclobacteriaceae bacterium]|nr:hypothetical protein [Cyclobacteriaceae bacterium]
SFEIDSILFFSTNDRMDFLSIKMNHSDYHHIPFKTFFPFSCCLIKKYFLYNPCPTINLTC